MRSRIVFSLFIVLGLVAVAHAAPAITVGDSHPLPAISANQTDTIDINYDSISGGGPMQGETIYISVAQEGAADGSDFVGAGQPLITGVDGLTGTVWGSNNAGNPPPAPVNNQVWSFSLTTGSGTNNATGKLLTVTIDRNGAAAFQSWGLRVFIGVPALGGPYSSAWDNGTSLGVPFATQDNMSGWQGVTGVPDGAFSYVPEPSSIVLGLFAAAGLGAVAIRRRRAHA
jgi:hypothetical protein